MVLVGGAFARWLGHGSGAFTSGVSALIKEIPWSSLAPQWEGTVYEQKEDPHQNAIMLVHADTYISDIQPPELEEIHFCYL